MAKVPKLVWLLTCGLLIFINAHLQATLLADNAIHSLISWYTILILLHCVLESGDPGNAATIGFLFGLLNFGVSLYWLYHVVSYFSIFIWALLAATYSVWAGMVLVLEGNQHIPSFRLVGPAALWTLIEYSRSEVSHLRFGWGCIGYIQQNWFGFKVASFIGVYGVGFVLLLWARLTLAAAYRCNGKDKRSVCIPVSIALLLVPTVCFIPGSPKPRLEKGRVRLQQFADQPGQPELTTKSGPVDLLVWPEYSFTEDPRHSPWAMEIIAAAAKHTRVGMIVGAISQLTPETEEFWNTAFVVTPHGKIAGSAVKNQPIQFLRDGKPASSVTVFTMTGPFVGADGFLSFLSIGIGVCYDGAYQKFARRMAQQGAHILIFPSYNLSKWTAVQHRQFEDIFRFRAAENNLQIFVASKSGPTFSADGNGVVIKRLPPSIMAPLDVPILDPPDTRPIFTRFGWIFAPLIGLVYALPAMAAKHTNPTRLPEADESTVVVPERGRPLPPEYSSCPQGTPTKKNETVPPPDQTTSGHTVVCFPDPTAPVKVDR